MAEGMDRLKARYEATPIPRDLSARVEALCEQYRPRQRAWRPAWRWALATAASLLLLSTLALNVLPAQAATLADVPVLGPLVRVLTFVEYTAEQAGYEAHIRIARVEGLDNQALEDAINAELLADGQALIAQYEADVAALKAEYGEETIHRGVETYHEVMCANDEVFSLRVEYFVVAGGSNTTYDLYNVNQRTGELMTLDTLFRPDSGYLDVINAYLVEQMRAETDETGHGIYYVGIPDMEHDYKGIGADHNFYINPAGQLVIAFDKYEAAPGYVGAPAFIIPTALIADMLVDGAPIR